MRKRIEVRGSLFPRAHLTLIGFNKDGYRKFGGAGFSFDGFELKFQAVESDSFKVEFFLNSKKASFESRKVEDILEAAFIKNGFNYRANFKFFTNYPRHSGFGTGTNITLACVESLFLINKASYLKDEIIEMSGRGRTSGIGINTYFNGGFVMDVGVKNADNVFLPSNLNKDRRTAKTFFSSEMPDWEFLVCIPKSLRHLTIEKEKSFFIENTPFEEEEVYRTLYEVVFGVSSAILESDFDTFCKALNNIQHTKWKCLERQNYKGSIKGIEKVLYKQGAKAVAMSSLGPALLVFSEDTPELFSRLEKRQNDFYVYKTRPRNTGRLIYA